MKARELMTPNPEVVTPDQPLNRAAQLMRDLDVGILPVVEDRSSMRLQGLITDRDITIRHVAEEHPGDCNIGHHMTRDHIGSVRPDDELDQVMELMKREQVRRIPVIEDGGKVVGIISQADLATHIGRQDPKKVEDVLERVSEPGEPTR